MCLPSGNNHRPFTSLMTDSSPIIKMCGITKRFGQVVANDQANFSLQGGEIHAIVGENGAGKSTLMKILYGLCQPDEGEIYFRERPVRIDNPRAAIRLGIGMVQQHFTLIPALTVLENIVLAREPRRFKIFLDTAKAHRTITALAEQLHFDLHPNAKVESLPIGGQQYAEILKALYHGAEVLILDEPTAVLAPQEVAGLFDCLRGLKAEGKSVILITHKLREVMEIADSITVMRRGRSVASLPKAQTDLAELSELMIGKHLTAPPSSLQQEEGKEAGGVDQPMLRMRDVTVHAVDGRLLLDRVQLDVFGGEIVGIAGVEGNGQNKLIEVLTGLRGIDGGKVTLHGESIANRSPAAIRRRRVVHLPADRHRHGISLKDRIDENLILGRHNRPPFCRRGLLQRKAIQEFADDAVGKYEIRTGGVNLPIRTLSGGNQQKVVVARELESDPELIIAAHPTRGLDISAARFVHQQLIDARNRAKGVLLISADLEEIMHLSDRIAVMYGGRIVGVVCPSETDEAQLGALMLGSADSSSDLG
ncbi:MAG: ABC transporter ATP-binding protein [Candidatus Poribacteria bacterium]|nr:ABC transporter ATP-binding protein [Candidatus Poribacteria bacterium]